MSYPDALYVGDKGEASAVYRPANSEPELRIGSMTVGAYLATGASTDGQFGLYRWDMAAQTPGAAPHFHKTISESFFVLSGTVKLFDGKDWVESSPGDFIYVPQGGIHGFRNESGAPASILILFVPGAPREAYFETLAEVASGKQMSPDDWKELYSRHDQYMV